MDARNWVDSYLAADDRRRAMLDPGAQVEPVRREALARINDVTPAQRGVLISLLGRIRLGNSAIRLFETLLDVSAPFDERALAFIVLSNCEPQLISERPHAVPDLGTLGKRALELTLDISNPSRHAGASAAAKPASTQSDRIVRMCVVLGGIEPRVWRRIEVPEDATLGDLHEIIRGAMGWSGRHQHLFAIGDSVYGQRHPELPDVRSEQRVTLATFIARGVRSLHYTYDLRNVWDHTIEIEEIVPREAAGEYPACTGGARACPPEHCGGPAGYARLLESRMGSASPDPEAFSVEDVNSRLARWSA
ncbi:MAG: plasmid pRiA4b ORF-3 family protein [Thermoanaerobaculia bacterium]